MHALPWAAFFFAAIPALLFVRNLELYRRLECPSDQPPASFPISVLIPARDEERSIEAAVRSVLSSTAIAVELIVLDDHSHDRTAAIVNGIAATDPRVRLFPAPPLPSGWCGKQWACHSLSQLASHPTLCFLDADVRLHPNGLKRMLGALQKTNVALISGFPHQETGTIVERMLIPLMHFLLLGFLPIAWMRRSTSSAFAAGCGQIMLVDREAYRKAGGHNAICSSRHDGIMLPKAFRTAGLRTDLFDLTSVATCRMYRNASEVFHGLLKNATEGIGSPARILPFTLLLGFGQVLPFVLLPFAWSNPLDRTLLLLACALAYLPRLIAVKWFRQSLSGSLLHPISVLLLLALQWWALFRFLAGGEVTWKGRNYTAPVS